MTMGPDAGRPHELEALPWRGPAVGLLDLDAFFASVEQLDHPEWRGRPSPNPPVVRLRALSVR